MQIVDTIIIIARLITGAWISLEIVVLSVPNNFFIYPIIEYTGKIEVEDLEEPLENPEFR